MRQVKLQIIYFHPTHKAPYLQHHSQRTCPQQFPPLFSYIHSVSSSFSFPLILETPRADLHKQIPLQPSALEPKHVPYLSKAREVLTRCPYLSQIVTKHGETILYLNRGGSCQTLIIPFTQWLAVSKFAHLSPDHLSLVRAGCCQASEMLNGSRLPERPAKC